MIGVFDSGIGGLSALAPLEALLPRADVLYYADTAFLPLGEKSDAQILARLSRAFAFFEREGVNGVLLACGTASSLLTKKCKESFAFPVVNIISPTRAVAKSLPKGTRVLLLGTPATIRSGVFASALARQESTVFSLPCPRFVCLAERGTPHASRVIRKTLAPALALAPDAVVLGCTHFPFLKEEIAAFFGNARLIDPAACAAAAAASQFDGNGGGERRFFTTGEPLPFAKRASCILRREIKAERITP